MKVPKFNVLKSSRRATIAAIMGGLVVVLGGSSALAARSNALPGSPLYPLKQLWEQGSLLLSFSPADKAKAHLNIARDRIKAAQQNPTPTPVLVPTLQAVQQELNSALNQTNNITNQSQRNEIKKSISATAVEAENEAEVENETEKSSPEKLEIEKAKQELKHVHDKASAKD